MYNLGNKSRKNNKKSCLPTYPIFLYNVNGNPAIYFILGLIEMSIANYWLIYTLGVKMTGVKV